jgi:hypothetical protein
VPNAKQKYYAALRLCASLPKALPEKEITKRALNIAVTEWHKRVSTPNDQAVAPSVKFTFHEFCRVFATYCKPHEDAIDLNGTGTYAAGRSKGGMYAELPTAQGINKTATPEEILAAARASFANDTDSYVNVKLEKVAQGQKVRLVSKPEARYKVLLASYNDELVCGLKAFPPTRVALTDNFGKLPSPLRKQQKGSKLFSSDLTAASDYLPDFEYKTFVRTLADLLSWRPDDVAVMLRPVRYHQTLCSDVPEVVSPSRGRPMGLALTWPFLAVFNSYLAFLADQGRQAIYPKPGCAAASSEEGEPFAKLVQKRFELLVKSQDVQKFQTKQRLELAWITEMRKLMRRVRFVINGDDLAAQWSPAEIAVYKSLLRAYGMVISDKKCAESDTTLEFSQHYYRSERGKLKLKGLEKLKAFFLDNPNPLYPGVQTLADMRGKVDQYNAWAGETCFSEVMAETLGLTKSALAKFARTRRIPVPRLHVSRPLGLGMIPIKNPPRFAKALTSLAEPNNRWCFEALHDNLCCKPHIPFKTRIKPEIAAIEEKCPNTSPHADVDPVPFLHRKTRDLTDAGVHVRLPEATPRLADSNTILYMDGPVVFVPNWKRTSNRQCAPSAQRPAGSVVIEGDSNKSTKKRSDRQCAPSAQRPSEGVVIENRPTNRQCISSAQRRVEDVVIEVDPIDLNKAKQVNLKGIWISVDRARELISIERNRQSSQTLDVRACKQRIQRTNYSAYKSAVYHVLPKPKKTKNVCLAPTRDDGGLTEIIRFRKGTIRFDYVLDRIEPLCTGKRLAEIAFNVLKDFECSSIVT